MPDLKGSSDEPVLFHGHITPSQSLSVRGQAIALGVVGAISLCISLVFVSLGYWPIAPFVGLDFALLLFAFVVVRRRSRAFEDVIVRPSGILIRRCEDGDEVVETVLPTAWLRLEREDDPDFGCQQLRLRRRHDATPVAQMLSPAERDAFGQALSEALNRARRGGLTAWQAQPAAISAYGAAEIAS